MKTTLSLLLALAALPLLAGQLADFNSGLGRVLLAGKPGFEDGFECSFQEDAIAPAPGKVLRVALSTPKQKPHARFDVSVMISPEEAAAVKALAFDVRADKPAAVSWVSLYFFPAKRVKVHMIAPSGTWRGAKPNEWKHVEIPVSAFKVLGGEMKIEDARQVCLSFFCNAPVELEFANIRLIE